MHAVAGKSLLEISRQARPYPSYLLPEHGSALALFAAGFLGWNDVVHFARAKMSCTCVDVDGENLAQMAVAYPEGWEFRVDDAWDFAEQALELGRTWDVVSVDPFLGDAAERAWDSLYMWTELATKLVTLTIKPTIHLNVPIGWEGTFFPRSDRAAWLVLQRA